MDQLGYVLLHGHSLLLFSELLSARNLAEARQIEAGTETSASSCEDDGTRGVIVVDGVQGSMQIGN